MTIQRSNLFMLALLTWPVFLLVAILLGTFREGIIAPAFGEQAAHVIGTLVFIIAMLAIIWVFVARVGRRAQQNDLWLVGLLWTAMTVSFEFVFFHFAAGVPWEKLLADYNIFAGRLWLLVLLTTLSGPALIAWLQKRR